MIVYRDDPGAPTDPRRLLAECRARARALAAAGGPSHDDVTGLLIDLGVLEAAVADALFPEADGRSPLVDALRAAGLACGRLFRRSWRGARTDELRDTAGALAALLDGLDRGSLPALVRPKVPEGYAYYALYPETYLAAAEEWARGAGSGPAVVVGIRSIGTSLASVVAAALEGVGLEVSSLTLRPHGHPFERRPMLAAGLANGLRDLAGNAWFLIVDEGPGLSASSLTGTAAVLVGLGVPDDQIVLFPSHLPDPAGFVSSSARERWGRHAKAHAPFEAAFPGGTPWWSPEARDLSGGGWRGLLYADERAWPAVHPWHERRKYLAVDADGTAVLHRFAGLGRFGTMAHRRATALAEAGFAPPVLGLERGFVRQVWVEGTRPLIRPDAGPVFLATATGYLAHLDRHHRTGGAARFDGLAAMLRANVGEAFGADAAARLGGLERHLQAFGEVPAVAVDGRMLPHEWLLMPAGGYLKTDGVDHHADHFFPGPGADVAWDVAGLAAELGLDDAAVSELAAGLGGAALSTRLPFHTAAYLAFRLGYATMAADTLAGMADGVRMGRLARRYRRQLGLAVERLASVL